MPVGLPSNMSKDNNEWVIDFTGARTVWDPPHSNIGTGIVVAHTDTGLTDHPELSANFARSKAKNFHHRYKYEKYYKNIPEGHTAINRDTSPFFFSHGTSTGSVLASTRGNNVTTNPLASDQEAHEAPGAYVSGVAPGAIVHSMLVADSVMMDYTSTRALIAAIHHCIKLQRQDPAVDVAIMSTSLGYSPWMVKDSAENAMSRALRAARDNGIVVCAAAGQFADMVKSVDPIFPAQSPYTICCAACDESKTPLSKGFYGPMVDITAPGINIWHAKTIKLSRFGNVDFKVWGDGEGTSYATAVTAGACALWQARWGRDVLISTFSSSANPGLLTDAFRWCLTQSATTPQGWDITKRGAGILDIEKLVTNQRLPTIAEATAMRDATIAKFNALQND